VSLLRAAVGVAARRRRRWWLVVSPLTLVVLLLVVLLGIAVIGMFGGGAHFAEQARKRGPNSVIGAGAGGTEWDAGNIFSDAVFYNAASYPDEAGVQGAIDQVGATCLVNSCLGHAMFRVEGLSSPACQPVPAEQDAKPYAHMLFVLARACGFNPQVAIVMVIKESQGFTRPSPPPALTGFGCPDSGPGGSANCDPSKAGVWAQTSGLFTAVAKLRQDPSKVNYLEGQSHDILWNIAESGCGAAPVTVANRATATLYTYTPYQPNAASIAAYPGTGDACSSYGNRNVFFLFQKYFGSTGGGRPAAGAVANPAVGLQQNKSQDPSTFGWTAGGPMEPLTYQGHSLGQVAKGTAPLWAGMLNDLVPQIPGGLNNNLGCYEYRNNVNSPGRLSFHAYGLACDINYDRNPNGANPDSLSGQYVIPRAAAEAVAVKWGMEWGGDWGFPDPMHFEIHLTPQQVASLTGSAA